MGTTTASCWTPKGSQLLAVGQGGPAARQPGRQTVKEKAGKAGELRDRGWSLSQIAKELGVSKATVVNYVRDHQSAGSPSTPPHSEPTP